jgi:predicted metal-dependent enzyme (double-stranded beta helix superfamily)
VTRLLYKPVSLTVGVLGGVLAGVVVKRVWKLATGGEDAPDATDRDKGWGEALASATIQGAIFALVKAAVDRGGAEGFRKLTGTWPD